MSGERVARGIQLTLAETNAVNDIIEIFTRLELTPDEQELARFPVVSAYIAGMQANGTEVSQGLEEKIHLGIARRKAIKRSVDQ